MVYGVCECVSEGHRYRRVLPVNEGQHWLPDFSMGNREKTLDKMEDSEG